MIAALALGLAVASQDIDGGVPEQANLEVGREVSYCGDRTLDIAYAVTPSVRVEFTSVLIDGVAISGDDLRIMNGFLNMFGWLDNLSARCRSDRFFLSVGGTMTTPMYEIYVGDRDGVEGSWTLRFGFTGARLTDEPETPQAPVP